LLFAFLSVSVVSILVDSQVNLFRPSPRHFANEHQSFRFSLKVFSWSALVGEGERRAAELFSTALEQQIDCLLFKKEIFRLWTNTVLKHYFESTLCFLTLVALVLKLRHA
jgi:hypothetical protein